MNQTDVLIVGGSYAGLSAAMSLGRSLRRVTIIDAGQSCNRQTPHAHNLITHDGQSPATITQLARQQVLAYPTVTFVNDFVQQATRADEGFVVETRAGVAYVARKIVLATGVVDQLPAVDGLADCWGISVLHCPYCHGYEVAHKRIGLLGNGDMGVELVKLIQNWSRQLVLFTNGAADFTDPQRTLLRQLNVPVVETALSAIEHEQGYVRQVRLADGSSVLIDALYVRPVIQHHTTLDEQLGCERTEMNLLKVDAFGRTGVAGVFAAGDNSTMMRSIAMAVANGSMAGAFINRELIEEQFV